MDEFETKLTMTRARAVFTVAKDLQILSLTNSKFFIEPLRPPSSLTIPSTNSLKNTMASRILTPILATLGCLCGVCCCLFHGVHMYDRQAMIDPVYMNDRRERQRVAMEDAWDRSNAALTVPPGRIVHHGGYFTEMLE